MKNKALKTIGFAALTAALIFAYSCDLDSPAGGGDESSARSNFDMTGTYESVHGTTTLNWTFKSDKTFEISRKTPSPANARTGTWSSSGSDVTLRQDPVSGVTPPPETLTASRSGNQITISVSGQTIQTLANWSVAGKSAVLTAAQVLSLPQGWAMSSDGKWLYKQLTGNTAQLLYYWNNGILTGNDRAGYYNNPSAAFTFPSQVDNRTVTVIGGGAEEINKFYYYYDNYGSFQWVGYHIFDELNVNSLVIPNTVQRIKSSALPWYDNDGTVYYSNIKNLTLPNNIVLEDAIVLRASILQTIRAGSNIVFESAYSGLLLNVSQNDRTFMDYYMNNQKKAGLYTFNYVTEWNYSWSYSPQ
jgi:hypothetical protein